MLERLYELRAVPSVIQSDNGPEFRGRVMDEWAYGALAILCLEILVNRRRNSM